MNAIPSADTGLPDAEAAKETMRSRYRTLLDRSAVPPHLYAGLIRYFVDHIRTGGFLESVLENDLLEAVGRADPIGRARLGHLVDWLLLHAPASAWGSHAAVTAWLASHELVPPDHEDLHRSAR